MPSGVQQFWNVLLDLVELANIPRLQWLLGLIVALINQVLLVILKVKQHSREVFDSKSIKMPKIQG